MRDWGGNQIWKVIRVNFSFIHNIIVLKEEYSCFTCLLEVYCHFVSCNQLLLLYVHTLTSISHVYFLGF